jgi:hypothetical protein
MSGAWGTQSRPPLWDRSNRVSVAYRR